MREVDGWKFVGYYTILWFGVLIFVTVGWLMKDNIGPLATLVFGAIKTYDLPMTLLVCSGMYWGLVLGYTLGIQRIRLKWK